ncbi:hypothetical protein [Desulfonatronum lacustre]|nr:hypothetical protein [Desulfonatronum lacustre]
MPVNPAQLRITAQPTGHHHHSVMILIFSQSGDHHVRSNKIINDLSSP